MTSSADWIAGARPRTLPAAVAPVLAGTGVAAFADGAVWWKALLALVVSLALQVGVNYANDYSDGIRGTDDERVGPLRLVGSGLATPGAVKRAAFLSFGVAGVAGLVLAATTSWWLVVVGALPHPGAGEDAEGALGAVGRPDRDDLQHAPADPCEPAELADHAHGPHLVPHLDLDVVALPVARRADEAVAVGGEDLDLAHVARGVAVDVALRVRGPGEPRREEDAGEDDDRQSDGQQTADGGGVHA